MIPVLVVFALTCVGLLSLVFLKPSVTLKGHTVSIYWSAPLLGALILIAMGAISPSEIFSGLTKAGEVNPIKILVLFISMTVMSIYLDELGFFRMLAARVLKHAKGNQMTLFILLYATVSVLTVFTSNDIIVLTFTPFICHFAKGARIDPVPYLVSEFVAANTWSMLLIIGNPTNIYLISGTGDSFLSYTAHMLLPTLLAGGASFAMLYLLFRKKLSTQIQPSSEEEKAHDKPLLLLGLLHLGGCIVILTLSSFIGLPMWLITLIFFISLVVLTCLISLIRRRPPTVLPRCARRAPWELIPFVLSMFVLVLALEKHGITAQLTHLLEGSDPTSMTDTVLRFGTSSFFASNILNNIPMSVLFRSVIEGMTSPAQISCALFSAVIGSNLGAFFTPTGALAGIIWTNQLNENGVRFSFARFVRYGATISIPSMAAALAGLIAVS